MEEERSASVQTTNFDTLKFRISFSFNELRVFCSLPQWEGTVLLDCAILFVIFGLSSFKEKADAVVVNDMKFKGRLFDKMLHVFKAISFGGRKLWR